MNATNHAPNVSPRPTPTSIVPTHAVVAEGVVVVDTLTPETEIHPTGSSSTPVHIADVEPVLQSMPPPLPAKRVTVLGLPAPSAIPAVAPKSRKRPTANPDAAKKRRCTRDTEAGPSCGSGLMSRQRSKFVPLIDEMINECGSEVERLAKELKESRERSSQLEGKLKVIEDAHSLEIAQFESRVGELE
ncbi:hypothetical protein Bca52824_023834 [Brassica carinata]|uniref:Uncharacterized protein n=1 Tax=Brassica carinata TaxID=52824 RepID=A0A8X8AUY8_BRACI|nr:hypothetical protein Bca52824_023834 [Brassica carinata]